MKNQSKKLKILHFGLLKSINPGIKQQLSSELKAAERLGENINWQICFFSHDRIEHPFMKQPAYPLHVFKVVRFLKYLTLRVSAYYWLLKHAKEYDAVILRYPLGDPILPFFLLKIKNYFTIHHTNELAEITPKASLLSRIHYLIEKYVGPFVLKRSQGIIGLTQEILDFELERISPTKKPGFLNPNGIDMETLPLVQDLRKGKIKLVYVCSKPYPWQGIDIIIEGLVKNKREDIELHLIGDINPDDYQKDSRITYHGLKDPLDLPSLFSTFDLGLGSFALYRISMNEACTLKTREYLSQGLPVYANHRDSGLPDDFPFFINKAFNLDDAFNIATHFRSISRQEIQQKAKPYIDKTTLLRKLSSLIEDSLRTSS